MDESYTALKWVAAHAADFGADGSRIAVAGNSVGGNMAAALTLMAKDQMGRRSLYRSSSFPRPMRARYGVLPRVWHREVSGALLHEVRLGHDAPDEKTRNNPYVSPLRASKEELQGLPPALVITSENDPLRDEGRAYARRLKDAGVAVTATRYNGMIHDFIPQCHSRRTRSTGRNPTGQ